MPRAALAIRPSSPGRGDAGGCGAPSHRFPVQNTPIFFGRGGEGWERWIASLHLPPFIMGQTILPGTEVTETKSPFGFQSTGGPGRLPAPRRPENPQWIPFTEGRERPPAARLTAHAPSPRPLRAGSGARSRPGLARASAPAAILASPARRREGKKL